MTYKNIEDNYPKIIDENNLNYRNKISDNDLIKIQEIDNFHKYQISENKGII